jgi:hypothetical protein
MPVDSCANGARGQSQRRPATSSHGGNPASPCQGRPELLQNPAHQRKAAKARPARMKGINRFATASFATQIG